MRLPSPISVFPTVRQGLGGSQQLVTFPVSLALGPPFLEDLMTSCSYWKPAFSPVEDEESGQEPWIRKALS